MNSTGSAVFGPTIVSALRDHARTAPERPAAICDGESCTYSDLDSRSECVASALQRVPRTAGLVAGVLASRSISALVEILGCLKAGWTAMPLDPNRPESEIWETLARAGASCCLLAKPVADPAVWPVPVLSESERPAEHVPPPPQRDIRPEEYCLYTQTTGTTGKPVLFRLTHRALLFHASNCVQALELTSKDRMALVIPLSAGAAVSIVFATLLAGGTICLIDPTEQGYEGLAQRLKQERITAAYFTASMFRAFVGTVGSDLRLPDLRVLKLGGEPVEAVDLHSFRAISGPDAVLVNGLGITDAGGNICFARFDRDASIPEGPLPIGFPVRGLEVRLEDEHGRDAETGEIVVRGPNLADPVDPSTGRLQNGLLRTGDLGRRLADGSLVHLGRKDELVKIRGRRVVPSMTDQVLRRVPGVRDAATVAIADRGGSHRLVAFIEGEGGEAGLFSIVSDQLPAQQVPSRIVFLDALPRLPGGKIDRRSLRREAPFPGSGSDVSLPPEDPLERQIHAVWCSVLRRDDVDLTTPFALLGGDSLTALEMLTRLHRITGSNLSLSDLREAPTIAMLTGLIRGTTQSGLWNVVVEMTRVNRGMPFICIPGAGSDVETLRDLAERVGVHRPFVALRMPGTDGSTWPPDTMDGILDAFLPALRRYRPHGPYLLGGSSFGGVVAYELALRLAAEGETIGAVALLDTYTSRFPHPRHGMGLSDRLRVRRRVLLPIGNKEEWSAANVRLGLRERRSRALARVRKRLGFDPRRFSAELRYVSLVDAALRAHRRYRPGRYDGRVDVFACATPFSTDLFIDDRTLGWNDIVGGDVVVHPVPGRHGQHIRPPFVDALADRLVPVLREA